MSKLFVATTGIECWHKRLARPKHHWKPACSAIETAMSWENASKTSSGVPSEVAELFRKSMFGDPALMIGIAEHKVRLRGGGGESQCDIWTLLQGKLGVISLAVEAKAKEPFGHGHECLGEWLDRGGTSSSRKSRQTRWEHLRERLPTPGTGNYSGVAYQLLHRCAAAVIEARRFEVGNAALVVQSFQAPFTSFQEYSRLCGAIGVTAGRGVMGMAAVGKIRLGVAWADCPMMSA